MTWPLLSGYPPPVARPFVSSPMSSSHFLGAEEVAEAQRTKVLSQGHIVREG